MLVLCPADTSAAPEQAEAVQPRRETDVRQLIYAMRFEGRATPEGPDGKVLRAVTTAPSMVVTSTVGPAGLDSRLEMVAGSEAAFESEVTFTGESSFLERGTIAFGHEHRLRFDTVGVGHLGASPDPTLKHGAVAWRVEGGEGQFAGASGLITSNFFVGPAGEVTDHHFGVIFVP
jgi:hypothetical protein